MMNNYYGNGAYCAPNNNFYPQGGFGVNPLPPKGVCTSTREDEEVFKKTGGGNDLTITELDGSIARCNHKDQNGMDTIIILDPETAHYKCAKCGTEWFMRKNELDAFPQMLDDFVGVALDILQTIKVTWLNPPLKFAQAAYEFEAVLKKFPAMYRAAKAEFDKISNLTNNQVYAFQNNNMYNDPKLTQFFGGAGNMMGMGAVPQQGYYYQQPMNNPQYCGQQPMYQPMMSQPMMPSSMNQPMPTGGTMLPPANAGQSPFVQGGVVPTSPEIGMGGNMMPNIPTAVPPTTTQQPTVTPTTPQIPTPTLSSNSTVSANI